MLNIDRVSDLSFTFEESPYDHAKPVHKSICHNFETYDTNGFLCFIPNTIRFPTFEYQTYRWYQWIIRKDFRRFCLTQTKHTNTFLGFKWTTSGLGRWIAKQFIVMKFTALQTQKWPQVKILMKKQPLCAQLFKTSLKQKHD